MTEPMEKLKKHKENMKLEKLSTLKKFIILYDKAISDDDMLDLEINNIQMKEKIQ